jgi:hypothetical protein
MKRVCKESVNEEKGEGKNDKVAVLRFYEGGIL